MSSSFQWCALLAVLVASVSAVTGQVERDCITSYSNTTNYFPYGYGPSEPFALPVAQTIVTAQKFTVQYNNAYKLVQNSYSNTSYLLYQCGAPVSDEFNSSVKPIELPVQAVAIDTTVIIGFLELLGLYPYLKGVSAQFTTAYASSPCFQKLVKTGQIPELNSSSTDFADFDGIVYSSLEQYPEFDSNYVYFDASRDPGPLRRAEWIKYLAVFFNMEEKATEIYNQIEANYQCLNGTNSLTTKPVVAWIYEWPKAVMTLSDAVFKRQLTTDAGGVNIDDSAFGTYNLSVASEASKFYSILEGVDIMIDEDYEILPNIYNISTFLNTLQIDASDSNKYPFLANKRVWRTDRRHQKGSTGIDWWEGSIPQPQVVLQELLGIINPTFDHTHVYFRNIAQGEKAVSLSADDCIAIDPLAPILPTIFTCPTSAPAPPRVFESHVSPPPPAPISEGNGSGRASQAAFGVLVLLMSVWVFLIM